MMVESSAALRAVVTSHMARLYSSSRFTASLSTLPSSQPACSRDHAALPHNSDG